MNLAVSAIRHIRGSVNRPAVVARAFGSLLALVVTSTALHAQTNVTSPREQFGFGIGDDYQLATYTQLEAYWHELAGESARMRLVDIGQTAENRTQWMAVITAPENFGDLDRYREISRRLALGEDLGDDEAHSLAREGKAVVWIDGGLHANEVVGAQQLIQLSYELTSMDDEETLRFLHDAIILLAPVNPDGMELVSSWYMRASDPLERSFDNLPRLYQKYIGHDNNRDFYRVAQPETENAARVLFREWFPQLTYNHHQTGPSDIFVFVPPFREPPAYYYDPLLVLGNQAVGLHMHQRLASEGKAGAGMRSRANYSTWYNGSIRTVGYYHNQIGMLTEMKGHPTPMQLAFFPDRMLAQNDYAMPITPGLWHFQQSIDYSMSLNRAFIDYASRNRERVLYDRYVMARRNIDKASTDTWTVLPNTVYEVEDSVRNDPDNVEALEFVFRRRGMGISPEYLDMFRRPENRDPRGFIIPSDQADFPTAVLFLNTLIKNGVEVLRGTSGFTIGSTRYPAGSYVVKTAQAFRPHILDMFEPQNHPDEFLFQGGPPIPPYDNGGWTLAFQMGVEFDRILDGFDGPFERVEGLATHTRGTVTDAAGAAGFLLSHDVVNSVTAVNRLLANGSDVYWLSEAVSANGESHPAGTIFVSADGSDAVMLEAMAQELGLTFEGVATEPSIEALKLRPVRVGLWDQYGGSMPSGWTRWLLEQHEFPYEVVFSPDLEAGDLDDSFDALVFPTEAIPSPGAIGDPTPDMDLSTIPTEYRDHVGRVGTEVVDQLQDFLVSGGHVTTIGSSNNLAYHLGLPVTNHMVDSRGEALETEEFYIPSSVLQIRVDTSNPLAYGVKERVDVMFDESPVFRLLPDADKMGLAQVGWYDNDSALRSGWAWGEDRLYGGTAIAEAEVGRGRLHMFAPEILFRGQPYGTFNFFFNSLYLAGAERVRLGAPVSE